MKLHEVSAPAGARKKSKRVGRGPGSGLGKTSGRGHKGQNSFEGGQMPLKRRLPKRGFTNIFKKTFALINVQDLERFEEHTVIDPAMMLEVGLINKVYDGVKVLGKGTLTKPLTVRTHRISGQAREKIEKAGGKAEII